MATNYKILSKGDWNQFCDKSKSFTCKKLDYKGYTLLLGDAYAFHIRNDNIIEETSIRESTFLTHLVVLDAICNRLMRGLGKKNYKKTSKKNYTLTAQLLDKYLNKLVEGED